MTQLHDDLRSLLDATNGLPEYSDRELLIMLEEGWVSHTAQLRNLLDALQRSVSLPRTMTKLKADLEKLFA